MTRGCFWPELSFSPVKTQESAKSKCTRSQSVSSAGRDFSDAFTGRKTQLDNPAPTSYLQNILIRLLARTAALVQQPNTCEKLSGCFSGI